MLFLKRSYIKFLVLLFTTLVILNIYINKGQRYIVITEAGFSPTSLSIIKGSTITWVNKGSLPHWPASDPHPIHTGYPSQEKGCIGSTLDACRGLNKGESYSFVFDQIGSWGIHDHLFHSHTMTVNVYNNYPELLTAQVKLFIKELKNNFKGNQTTTLTLGLNQAVSFCSAQDHTKFIYCLKNALKKPIEELGVTKLVSDLEQSYKNDDSANSGGITRCHDIAHAIGQAGVSFTKDPKQVLDQCTDLCTSGCYHGAVEQYVLDNSSDTLLANMNNLCTSAACFHGLGHGLASIAQFDLKKSLQLCDKLNDDSSKMNCGFGVFMELYEPSSFNPVPLSIPENLPAFCSNLTGVYSNVCYRNIGNYEYVRTKDVKKAFSICEAIPKDYGRDCRLALGQAAYFNGQGKVEFIISICKNVSGDQFKDCIDGSLMSSVSSDPLARHSFEICSRVDDVFKKNCYQFLGGHIEAVYGKETRQKLCNNTCDKI